MKRDAEKNRTDFPFAAAIVDELRQVFGDGVKVLYAKENGREIGVQTMGEFVKPISQAERDARWKKVMSDLKKMKRWRK